MEKPKKVIHPSDDEILKDGKFNAAVVRLGRLVELQHTGNLDWEPQFPRWFVIYGIITKVTEDYFEVSYVYGTRSELCAGVPDYYRCWTSKYKAGEARIKFLSSCANGEIWDGSEDILEKN